MPELGAQRLIAHARAGATLTVQLTREEHGTEIIVLGDLGTAEADLLRDSLAALAGQDAERVVVDLRRAVISRAAWDALARPDFDGVVLRGAVAARACGGRRGATPRDWCRSSGARRSRPRVRIAPRSSA
jgi:hypothetical protein